MFLISFLYIFSQEKTEDIENRTEPHLSLESGAPQLSQSLAHLRRDLVDIWGEYMLCRISATKLNQTTFNAEDLILDCDNSETTENLQKILELFSPDFL